MNRDLLRLYVLPALVFAICSVGCSHDAVTSSPAPRATPAAPTRRTSEDDDDIPVQQANLPAPVQATVSRQSSGATIHGLSKSTEDGRLTYELELVMADGHRKDMDIAPDGAVLEVEEQIELAKVPEVARAAIQGTAGSRTIRRVEAVSRGDGTLVGYEVGVSDGAQRSEFRVGADGKPLSDDDD